MNDWLVQQGIDTPQTALLIGLLLGTLLAVFAAWVSDQR